MKYRTRHARGYLPAGMTVEVVSLSHAGGLGRGSRDYGLGGGGQWLLVKHPDGILHGMVRTTGELAGLGIGIADLEEVRE